jgi:hypothetical protein
VTFVSTKMTERPFPWFNVRLEDSGQSFSTEHIDASTDDLRFMCALGESSTGPGRIEASEEKMSAQRDGCALKRGPLTQKTST